MFVKRIIRFILNIVLIVFSVFFVIIVHVEYSVCLVYSTANTDVVVIVFHVYTVTIVDIVFFVNIVVSEYNVAHVYKALVDITTVASCVYIVAIGFIPYN